MISSQQGMEKANSMGPTKTFKISGVAMPSKQWGQVITIQTSGNVAMLLPTKNRDQWCCSITNLIHAALLHEQIDCWVQPKQ